MTPASKFNRSASFAAASKPTSFPLRSGRTKFCLGRLGDIQRRSRSCPLCTLVTKSLQDIANGLVNCSLPQSALDATCQVKWEIDGRECLREGSSDARNRTRRLRICWDNEILKECESYLVFVAPENHNRPNSDAQTVWRKDTHFLGRTIDPMKSKQALIVSWLGLCLGHHGRRCVDRSSTVSRFREMLGESYFGVIDVVNMQLTALPYDLDGPTPRWEPYVTLSYVWGRPDPEKGGPYVTKRSNILLHQSHGGLEDVLRRLPQVIQDAIRLVQKIGIRFIWVDSICIVQDSPRSWKLNAQNMDLIYGNAIMTICAADGNDASTGLRAMELENSPSQLTERCTPDVRLMVSRPPEIGIQASRWNKRAWTFQERLLSQRCLIFTNGRVYWQCRSTDISEDIFADGRGGGWSLNSIHSPLQMLDELKNRAFWFYTKCVSLYTSRELTRSGDVLAAFEGICSLIQDRLRAPFIFGLPTSHLDLALLWQPRSSLGRRIVSGDDKWRDLEFPSWAWCGWTGAQMDYQAEMVDGCLDNVHEWLVNHTWICWYIRDGHGNLRPLWNKDRSEEDRSTETRWKGYRARKHVVTDEYSDFDDEDVYLGDNYNTLNLSGKERWLRDKHHESISGGWALHQERVLEGERERSTKELFKTAMREVEESKREEIERIKERRAEELKAREDFERHKENEEGRASFSYRESGDEERIIVRRRPQKLSPEEERRLRYRRNQEYGDNSRDDYDDWGRAHWIELDGKPQGMFSQTTPENPYRVLHADFTAEPHREFPDQPLLQFWTWQTSLHTLLAEDSDKNVGEGLCRCDIADAAGDWCGSIVLDEKWLKRSARKGTMFEFIALSEAKAFTEEECPAWTYYIPKERHESEWNVFYVLMIEYNRERSVYQRVALGKVFRAAFAGSEWKEITLG